MYVKCGIQLKTKRKKLPRGRPSISFLCPFRWVRVCAAPREVLGATSFFFAISGKANSRTVVACVAREQVRNVCANIISSVFDYARMD
jgi:hypothetical protein